MPPVELREGIAIMRGALDQVPLDVVGGPISLVCRNRKLRHDSRPLVLVVTSISPVLHFWFHEKDDDGEREYVRKG
jgi:hypothetical protein